MNCRDCEDNENGLCDRYGRLVDDDDICYPVFRVRCSWCGQRIVLKQLMVAAERHADFQFYCPTCRQFRYFRKRDIEEE